jgi:hypothetical protein
MGKEVEVPGPVRELRKGRINMTVARDIAAGITKAPLGNLCSKCQTIRGRGNFGAKICTRGGDSAGVPVAKLGLEVCRLDLQEVLIRSTWNPLPMNDHISHIRKDLQKLRFEAHLQLLPQIFMK